MTRADRMAWVSIYPSDFFGSPDVLDMSGEAQGAYALLLLRSWQVGPLADPIRELRRRSLEHVAPEVLWKEIRVAWELGPDGWTNPRLERERAKAGGQIEKSKKGNAARWSSHGGSPTASPGGSPTGSQGASPKAPLSPLTPHPSPLTETPPLANASGSPHGGEVSPGVGTPERSGSKSSKPEKTTRRKPTENEVSAAVRQYGALQALPGFEDSVLAWREELGAKKRWASVEALHLHLRWLEKRSEDALDLVEIARANRWTDPTHAERLLQRDRTSPGDSRRNGQRPSNVYRCPDHLRKL